MAVKWSSQGAKLQVEIATVFTDIPSIQGFPWPETNTQYEDTTTLDSAGNFKEYQAIMNDTSEISLNGFWDPTSSVHDFLMDESVKAQKVAIPFKAISPDSGAATMAFSAFISFSPTTEQNSSMKFTLKLRVTGALTYTQ